jgi:glycine/D-amino acid oxidase-like deaminating enzyme
MFAGDDGYARASLPLLADAGLPAEEIDLAAARRRFPQVDFDGVATVFVEERAGYLTARRACQLAAREVAGGGGEVRTASAEPGPMSGSAMSALPLSDGTLLAADAYVFACGPWLGRLFPELVGSRIRPTRQEVFFFGTPAADPRFDEARCPVWVDFGERIFYGIPGNESRGFKVADDTRGEEIDPTSGERVVGAERLAEARALLARRFPALAGAPLVDARVCQYENTPDGDLLLDRHPEAENVWLAGGGSGHGFKLAPVVGEHVASLVLGDARPLPQFRLARFAAGVVPEKATKTQFESR